MTVPSIDLRIHHHVSGASDAIAFGFTKTLRFCVDTFSAKRYGHRAIVLETVAAVPGMVGATLTHLRCLRRMSDDKGWIRTPVRWEVDPSEAASRPNPQGNTCSLTPLGEAYLAERVAQ
jgi:hypothetical protein